MESVQSQLSQYTAATELRIPNRNGHGALGGCRSLPLGIHQLELEVEHLRHAELGGRRELGPIKRWQTLQSQTYWVSTTVVDKAKSRYPSGNKKIIALDLWVH